MKAHHTFISRVSFSSHSRCVIQFLRGAKPLLKAGIPGEGGIAYVVWNG